MEASGQQQSEAFLRSIPKTDLHIHLDGSLRLSTLMELSKEQGHALPAETEDGLQEAVFKRGKFADLFEYLDCFRYTTQVLQDPASLERVSYELACDLFADNVRYFEVRFAPQLHADSVGDTGFTVLAVIASVCAGLERAKTEWNARDEGVARGPDGNPPFECGVICCAMRLFSAETSRYYGAFIGLHRHEDMARVNGLASMAIACAAWRAKEAGLGVVGIDLAGAEAAAGGVGEAHHHAEAFEWARQHYLARTVHAGEALGPESMREAVMALHAQRIGHGFALFSQQLVSHAAVVPNRFGDVDARAVPRYDPLSLPAATAAERALTPLSSTALELGRGGGAAAAGVLLDESERRSKYVLDLSEEMGRSNVCIEVCLSSNVGTMPILQGGAALHKHALGQMLESRLRVSLATDNMLVSNTTVLNEYRLAIETFGLSRAQVKTIAIDGIRSAFFPGTCAAKRAYTRQWVAMYERAEVAAFGDTETHFTFQ